MRAIVILVALLLATEAHAVEHEWSAGADFGYAILGDERTTGGLALGAHGSRAWTLGTSTTLHTGAIVSVIGAGDDSHWLGLVAGPELRVDQELGRSGVSLDVAVDAAYGRLPACHDWGLCLRYWGLFPAASVRAAYGSERGTVAVGLTGRYVNTKGWTGMAWAPSVSGQVAF